jgi:effector-binding domain-containing protein
VAQPVAKILVEDVNLAGGPGVAIRERVPVSELPEFFGRAFGQLAGYIQGAGGEFAGPPFARYLDFEPRAIDVEAVFPLVSALPGNQVVQAIDLPAGPALQVRHFGPYDSVGPAYDAIDAWMREHGLKSAGPPREVYLTEPATTPDPAKWETLIVQPVAPA